MKLAALTSTLPLIALSGVAMAQPFSSTTGDGSISISIEGTIPAERPGNAQPNPIQGSAPIETLIQQVAADTGREFVVDQRSAGTMVYTTSNDVDYESLLGLLRISGLVAIETGDQIMITPEQNMRTEASRILNEDDNRVSDHEVVTRVINVPELDEIARTNEQGQSFTTPALSATQLVPVLRPMMSQSAQLGAIPNTNALIVVDRYDNVRRMTAVIEAIIDGIDE